MKPRLSPAMQFVIDQMQAGRVLTIHTGPPAEAYLTPSYHPKRVTVQALKRRGLIRLESRADGFGRPMEGTRWRYWLLTRKGRLLGRAWEKKTGGRR